MICIGADQDGTGTLTFQTAGTLPNTTTFGSNALWNGSTAQSLCNDFGNRCSATASIKSVTKKTSSASNGNQNNTADVQTTAKCWLPSECEMGFTSSSGYASSYQEWTVGGSQTAYSYYTSNSTRVKYQMNANGSLTSSTMWYWERSRHYATSFDVCCVSTDGSAYHYTDGFSRGLAPAFVIG